MNRKSVLCAALDQGFASLATLAMSLCFIVQTTPEIFGQYTYIFTLVMIASSLLYGLVGVPLLVEIRPLEGQQRDEALSILNGFDFYFRVSASIAVSIAALAVTNQWQVIVSASLFGFSWFWRETLRNRFFAINQPERAASLTSISFVFLLLFLLGVFATATINDPSLPMAAAAFSNLIAIVVVAKPRKLSVQPPKKTFAQYRKRFPKAGWTLANSASNEAQTRAHVLIVEAIKGTKALGILEAARILFAPLFLASAVWQRGMQPRIAVLVSEGKLTEARRLTLIGAAVMATLCAAYGLPIYFLYDWIAERLFGDRFGDLSWFTIGWWIYATMLLCAWTLTTYLNAIHAYRHVATISFTSAIATIILLIALTGRVELLTILAILTVIQLGKVIALFISLWAVRPADSAIPNVS